MRSFLLLCLLTSASAWSTSMMTGSRVSGFGGSVLLSREEQTSPNQHNQLVMKKGKSNIPTQMRSQYAKQKEMAAQREQMVAASKPGEDGLPVFNLFVRTQKQNMWYPCGSFKGDARSAALAKSVAEGGLLSGISQKQMDGGIAGSLARDLDKLKETIVRAYPQLRKSKKDFEFGYKLAYQGLSEEQQNAITPVEPKEQKGFLDGVKNIFS